MRRTFQNESKNQLKVFFFVSRKQKYVSIVIFIINSARIQQNNRYLLTWKSIATTFELAHLSEIILYSTRLNAMGLLFYSKFPPRVLVVFDSALKTFLPIGYISVSKKSPLMLFLSQFVFKNALEIE